MCHKFVLRYTWGKKHRTLENIVQKIKLTFLDAVSFSLRLQHIFSSDTFSHMCLFKCTPDNRLSQLSARTGPIIMSILSSLFLCFLTLVLLCLSPQICNLEEQLEQFREELENKSEEVQQLHMQLEIQRKEISSQQQFTEMREGMIQVSTLIAFINNSLMQMKHKHWFTVPCKSIHTTSTASWFVTL